MIKQIKRQLLKKQLDRVLGEASKLRRQGFIRLYNWKMNEAKSISSKLGLMEEQKPIHVTEPPVDIIKIESNFLAKNRKTTPSFSHFLEKDTSL